ncbi:MAG: 2,3-bisphosphoglycerate-independent phosphoglycerate mutase [Aequoribacter sp.]|uniref:2,3-bisphosphoglycerate-independent phosphoglycerate mutase n=1 Tax=Aequoribacter sp. TaxID=2847771 RepID=UPI003C523895
MPDKIPTLLIILDGFGHREAKEDNAIANASTPTWDHLWSQRPHSLISGSGLDVGLPDGQMGNSEVGHMSLGAGRIIYQQITRIDKAIEDGEFFSNPALCQAIDSAQAHAGAVHIFGLLSPGGVHSHENHIIAAMKLAAQRGATKIYLHAFLDGRDTPPRSAKASLQAVEAAFTELGKGQVASVVGRYYAMDRDQRWDRVEQAYTLITEGKGKYTASSSLEALEQAYRRDENDEFVAPTAISTGEPIRVEDGDSIIFMNFRADRAREITQCFVDPDFHGFERQRPLKLANFTSATEYAKSLPTEIAFPGESLSNVLGAYLADLGKTQLRIAETEKYAHVTFFFSGGQETLFDGEKRELIPSPDVATYDLQPEMSAPEVTAKLCEAIRSKQFDLIVCNYANGDMVGHTGNYQAAIKAVEALDQSLAQVEQALAEVGGQALITADHGNCEQMLDYDSGQLHTQHTTEHVPLVYIGPKNIKFKQTEGRLADIAPSLLNLMELDIPAEMTGQCLIENA